MTERVHRIDLCPDCDGLSVVDGARFQATDVQLTGPDGPIGMGGPATITFFPVGTPSCPNSSEEAGRG